MRGRGGGGEEGAMILVCNKMEKFRFKNYDLSYIYISNKYLDIYLGMSIYLFL